MPYYSSSNEEEIKIFFLLSLISQDVSYEYLIGLWFIYKKSKTLEVKTNKKKKKKTRNQCVTFLARLFSKETSRYCHSPGVGGGGVRKL